DGTSVASASAGAASAKSLRFTTASSWTDGDVDDQRFLYRDVVPGVLNDRGDASGSVEGALSQDVIAADPAVDLVVAQVDLRVDPAELGVGHALTRALIAERLDVHGLDPERL